MLRALFEKTGTAVWISHLDLMRLFQRAFARANLPLKHTQGFNPRPSVSIALPLSVGMESVCELLDFEVEGNFTPEEITKRLNETLIDGVRVREVYEGSRKIRDLALLECEVFLEYDAGVPENALEPLTALFGRESIVVTKKSKNGPVEQDIRPMLREALVRPENEQLLALSAIICCQNPTLNPALLLSAIEKYAPEAKPDFAKIKRLEIYDKDGTVFR